MDTCIIFSSYPKMWKKMITEGASSSRGLPFPDITEDVDSTALVVPSTLPLPPIDAQTSVRRKRKNSQPACQRLANCCSNSACRAELKSTDAFCKRCSCYICEYYDDNKIPSFWLVCEAKTHSQDKPCGLSCHLVCALKNGRAGNKKGKRIGMKLDGSFQCGNCGTVNDLISCWRKLLIEAKDVRRLGDLCSRICLSHKILDSTEKYQKLHEIVDTIKRKLEDEVGSLSNLPETMSHYLVPRFPFGTEAQDLCSVAISLLDALPLTTSQFNCTEFQNCEVGGRSASNLEGAVNAPVSELKGDEQMEIDALPNGDLREIGNEIDAVPISTCDHIVAFAPILGIEEGIDGSKGRNETKIGCNKFTFGPMQAVKTQDDYMDTKYRESVHMIRQLERDGHINSSFRKEFLTWLSMRASAKRMMQVNVFVENFSDDLQSLAEQLVHTFYEEIHSKKLASNAAVN